MQPNRYNITFIGIIFAAILLFLGPIPQPIEYHDFADMRTLFGVPNSFDVLSNIPFAIVALLAFRQLSIDPGFGHAPPMRIYDIIFFMGVFLTAFGSAYYHWAPDNHTLVWDRLPMTIAFMAFFGIMLDEAFTLKHPKSTLVLLIAIGLLSIVYWQYTEQRNMGDLRPYIMVQFLPMIIIPWLLLKNPNIAAKGLIWGLFAFYIGAKVTEHFDEQIYHLLGDQVSGHTIKHLLAAAGVYCYLLRCDIINQKTINTNLQ